MLNDQAPLILDESVPATILPERFQRVTVEADTKAIREALEAAVAACYRIFKSQGCNIAAIAGHPPRNLFLG